MNHPEKFNKSFLQHALSFIFLLILCSQFSLLGQTNAMDLLRDSVPEVIVYEDDTVYMAPDTIRITDTIVHLIHENIVKEKKLAGTPKEFGIFFMPFITGFSRSNLETDSLSSEKAMGYNTSIRLGFHKQYFDWYLQVGYESVQSRIRFSNSHFESGTNVAGVYDSLKVTARYLFRNYYRFIYIQPGIGKHWISQKYVVGVYVNGQLGYLLQQSGWENFDEGIKNKLSANHIRKYNVVTGIQLDFGYKIAPNFVWHIVPAYSYKFNGLDFQPMGDSHRVAVSIGLSTKF